MAEKTDKTDKKKADTAAEAMAAADEHTQANMRTVGYEDESPPKPVSDEHAHAFIHLLRQAVGIAGAPQGPQAVAPPPPSKIARGGKFYLNGRLVDSNGDPYREGEAPQSLTNPLAPPTVNPANSPAMPPDAAPPAQPLFQQAGPGDAPTGGQDRGQGQNQGPAQPPPRGPAQPPANPVNPGQPGTGGF